MIKTDDETTSSWIIQWIDIKMLNNILNVLLNGYKKILYLSLINTPTYIDHLV